MIKNCFACLLISASAFLLTVSCLENPNQGNIVFNVGLESVIIIGLLYWTREVKDADVR